MPTRASRPASSQLPACANCSSPSFTPVSSCGLAPGAAGTGSSPCRGSRRRRRARPSNTGITNRGSHRVEHVGGAVLAGEGRDGGGVGGVDPRRREPRVVADAGDRRARPAPRRGRRPRRASKKSRRGRWCGRRRRRRRPRRRRGRASVLLRLGRESAAAGRPRRRTRCPAGRPSAATRRRTARCSSVTRSPTRRPPEALEVGRCAPAASGGCRSTCIRFLPAGSSGTRCRITTGSPGTRGRAGDEHEERAEVRRQPVPERLLPEAGDRRRVDAVEHDRDAHASARSARPAGTARVRCPRRERTPAGT